MFKKLLIASVFCALTFSCVGVNAMEKNIINETTENREKQKLNDLDLSLTNLIKDFNAELVKIKETSNNYAGSRLIKNIEKYIQELKEKEYFPPWEITNENDDNLHSKKTFDIYKVTSDLLNNIEKMENLLIDLETKYQEYLRFTKNIKHEKLLDSYNNKNNIDNFNTDIGYLQNVISFILFTVNLPNWNFCKKLNDEKIYKTIDKTEIFKKQIEIRKEIILFIKKVVQSDIIGNMEAKILDAVDEEAKIRNQYY